MHYMLWFGIRHLSCTDEQSTAWVVVGRTGALPGVARWKGWAALVDCSACGTPRRDRRQPVNHCPSGLPRRLTRYGPERGGIGDRETVDGAIPARASSTDAVQRQNPGEAAACEFGAVRSRWRVWTRAGAAAYNSNRATPYNPGPDPKDSCASISSSRVRFPGQALAAYTFNSPFTCPQGRHAQMVNHTRVSFLARPGLLLCRQVRRFGLLSRSIRTTNFSIVGEQPRP